jgi:16S rRNA (cytidine1402-2'-O)-methyltransferase
MEVSDAPLPSRSHGAALIAKIGAPSRGGNGRGVTASGERAPEGANGILYIVATPIGNPDDVTARAIRVLSEADLIACEDTRRTGHLLGAHSIRTPTLSYFEHNEERRTPELIERLMRGAKIALVTDAGTPAISDPGYRLVRAAHEAGVRVAAVPGPSAAIAALSIAGLPTDRFVFEGFLPTRANARRAALKRLAREERTIVIFEAARRLAETLDDMAVEFGADRMAAIAREITKTFEETVRGTLGELARTFKTREALGEVTLVVEGARKSNETAAESGTEAPVTVDVLRDAGLSLKQASTVVAKLRGLSRREVYQNAIRTRRNGD